jgi:hypothetical protein
MMPQMVEVVVAVEMFHLADQAWHRVPILVQEVVAEPDFIERQSLHRGTVPGLFQPIYAILQDQRLLCRNMGRLKKNIRLKTDR